ncbi:hypothetical protein D1AOALGA4SA_7902 [Olavius algarvensis Delta 1 endosymbiont]|nr:hypothetical protein D1AOALGA4SA_7902 [Olavius algarvensis Delta 1 endosymbiont]
MKLSNLKFRFGFCPSGLSLFICRPSCPPVCFADQRQI